MCCIYCEEQHTIASDNIDIGPTLTCSQKEQVSALISKLPDKVTTKLGKTDLIKYYIKGKDTSIKIRARPNQYTCSKLQALQEHVDDLLKEGGYYSIQESILMTY